MSRTGAREPKRDKNLGTVHIWTRTGSVPTTVADVLDDRIPRQVHAHTDSVGEPKGDPDWLRGEFDGVRFYVHGGNDSAEVTRAAMAAGCPYAVSLPAARDWLAGTVRALVEQRRDVAIVVRGGGR